MILLRAFGRVLEYLRNARWRAVVYDGCGVTRCTSTMTGTEKKRRSTQGICVTCAAADPLRDTPVWLNRLFLVNSTSRERIGAKGRMVYQVCGWGAIYILSGIYKLMALPMEWSRAWYLGVTTRAMSCLREYELYPGVKREGGGRSVSVSRV